MTFRVKFGVGASAPAMLPILIHSGAAIGWLA